MCVRVVIVAVSLIFSQSNSVKGLISLTCDAWQASNSDGYFAVTGSWINEENAKWQLQTALLGFTQLNNAHNGTRLGQALFKIVLRVRIAHKVSTINHTSISAIGAFKQIGWVTCDNAKNNKTMLDEFAKHISVTTGKGFDPKTRYIR